MCLAVNSDILNGLSSDLETVNKSSFALSLSLASDFLVLSLTSVLSFVIKFCTGGGLGEGMSSTEAGTKLDTEKAIIQCYSSCKLKDKFY